MKKVKYSQSKDFLFFLKKFEKNVLIISHIHYLDMFDVLKLKQNCFNNNIFSKKIKNNLIKKLFKNIYFNNLLSGPTIFFFSKKLENLITFFTLSNVKKKFLPLIIY
jgi:ribosomal protein L10